MNKKLYDHLNYCEYGFKVYSNINRMCMRYNIHKSNKSHLERIL